ncbi:MAG: TPM domain-containing protein [Chitinophagaceae bacterium]|nr:MAG: TPM domain-containing protein [Chitinophagaceae bacterium]
MFSLFKKPEFLSASERESIVASIKAAEQKTSGEIRVYIESHCRFVDPLDRAAEIFWNLKMDHTEQRNAVLLYVAAKDHQMAVLGDEGIHQKVGNKFWNEEVAKMRLHFQQNHYMDALVYVIEDIGKALVDHFPYDSETDKNELPDDIVFGK